MAHRIEVYMDSYNNKPIIQEVDDEVRLKVGDELGNEEWQRLIDDPVKVLAQKVKVADVRQFWDTEVLTHAISIKLVAVE